MFGLVKLMRAGAARNPQPASVKALSEMDVWRPKSAGGTGLTDELLHARLAETVAWCDSLTSRAELRSTQLQPPVFHEGRDNLVCSLGRRRQHQLRYADSLAHQQSTVVTTGRFMLYFPDENLADGYAQEVSGGFFDVDNVPAYDTWVSMISDDAHPRPSARQQLLCYVPEPLMEAANAGIDGNPEECIVWLDATSSSIRERVKALTSGPWIR